MTERPAGKYELLEKLATGGMAEVFLARVRGPADFERRLVIKRVLPSLAAEKEFTRLFELEARYAALIEHPNVAQVYDFGHDGDGRPWLAMEYVDGASVRDLLRATLGRGERADARLVAHVFARAAEGLAAAHGLLDRQTRAPLHLVHRDVSPDNLLVSRVGAVKVSDFGIARAMVMAGTTHPNQMRGKLRYLAPEQVRGEAPSLAVDVWAMGVCLFEALAGQRPFPEDNEGHTVSAIAHGERPALVALRPDCPAALVAAVDACLAVDLARRMPDCHELAVALDRFVAASGPPITTSMVGAWVDRLVPPRSRSEAPKPERWLPDLGTPASQPSAALVAAAPPLGDPVELQPTSAFATRFEPDRAPATPPPAAPSPAASAPAASAPAEGALTGVPDNARATGGWRRWVLVAAGLALVALGLGVVSERFPATPPPARIVVTSTPSGATVRLDGQDVGKTPWGGDWASRAPIEVEVHAPGYAPWKTTLPPGEDATLDVPLKRR
ncbi:MAG: serine/threonine protein kinase [Myxococcales bacterium]|nr:serine/threonine protein kinase [Myxococcales bacterium]